MLPTLVFLLAIGPADAKKRDQIEPPPPPVRPELIYDEPQETEFEPGSLWDEVPARRMMGLDGNARQVGDLVTVQVVERTATSLDAETTTARDSESGASLGALFGAQTTITEANPGMGGEIALSGGSSTSFAGRGSTVRESLLESMITCEVLEVLPTGNLRIWGYKQVRVNSEIQYVVVEGLVRPRDIRLDNTVHSNLLAQATIEVTGGGVVAEKQRPGFGQRLLDILWPF